MTGQFPNLVQLLQKKVEWFTYFYGPNKDIIFKVYVIFIIEEFTAPIWCVAATIQPVGMNFRVSFIHFLIWFDSQELLKQNYVASRLKSSQQKLYSCHHKLVDRYEISISQIAIGLFPFTYILLSSITYKNFTGLAYVSNTTGAL